MQMICINTGKMAEDDVADVVLAAAAFIEMFGSDTDDNNEHHTAYVVCFRCAMSTIEHFRINRTLYALSQYLVGLGPEAYL